MLMSDQTLANLSLFPPFRAFPSVFLFCPPPSCYPPPSRIFPRLFRSLLSVKRAVLLPPQLECLFQVSLLFAAAERCVKSRRKRKLQFPLFFLLRQTAAKGGKKTWHKSLYPTLVGDRPQVRQAKSALTMSYLRTWNFSIARMSANST